MRRILPLSIRLPGALAENSSRGRVRTVGSAWPPIAIVTAISLCETALYTGL